MIILGIDTSLRSTGIAVVESRGNSLRAVEWGTIRNPDSRTHAECLAHIHDAVSELIARHKPNAVAIEGVFFCRNVKTAVVLGEARGVVMAVCGRTGLPVFEYAPRRVKQALVGAGGAHKQQVGRMVRALLSLREDPQEDAADALAIAICHAHSRSGLAGAL